MITARSVLSGVYASKDRGVKGTGTSPGDKADKELESATEADLRETILLAEDDADVRWFIKIVLEEYYYRVIEAGNGDEAVKIFSEHGKDIDLLVFDIKMPGKSGEEAYNEIKRLKPDIKVLFTSGYHGDIVQKSETLKGLHFIGKPFTPVEFLEKVREVLCGVPRTGPSF